MKTNIEIEMVPLADLIHPDYNPRFMPSDQMETLETELEEFGMVENVVVNRRNMHIVGGNQRVTALRRMKAKTAPVVYVDLDDAAEKRLNLALNKISGQWDNVKLTEVLQSLEGDYSNTGFNQEEVDALLDKISVNDLEAPGVESIGANIELKFGDHKANVPREVYDNFTSEINRIKMHLYPKEEPSEVSVIQPLEFLVAQSAGTPLPE